MALCVRVRLWNSEYGRVMEDVIPGLERKIQELETSVAQKVQAAQQLEAVIERETGRADALQRRFDFSREKVLEGQVLAIRCVPSEGGWP